MLARPKNGVVTNSDNACSGDEYHLCLDIINIIICVFNFTNNIQIRNETSSPKDIFDVLIHREYHEIDNFEGSVWILEYHFERYIANNEML